MNGSRRSRGTYGKSLPKVRFYQKRYSKTPRITPLYSEWVISQPLNESDFQYGKRKAHHVPKSRTCRVAVWGSSRWKNYMALPWPWHCVGVFCQSGDQYRVAFAGNFIKHDRYRRPGCYPGAS